MKTDYSDHWPVCYRSQDEAGLPKGPIEAPEPPRALFVWGFVIGLILVGPAILDTLEALR